MRDRWTSLPFSWSKETLFPHCCKILRLSSLWLGLSWNDVSRLVLGKSEELLELKFNAENLSRLDILKRLINK